jgi:hypothetical protein
MIQGFLNARIWEILNLLQNIVMLEAQQYRRQRPELGHKHRDISVIVIVDDFDRQTAISLHALVRAIGYIAISPD